MGGLCTKCAFCRVKEVFMAISDNEIQLEKKYLEVVTKELRDKISSIGSNLYEAEEKVNELAKKIVTEDMSVRDLERLSQDVKSDVIVKGTSSSKKGFDHKYRMYENIIMDTLDTKVRVSKKKIEIYFDGVEELEEILSKMNVKVEEE